MIWFKSAWKFVDSTLIKNSSSKASFNKIRDNETEFYAQYYSNTREPVDYRVSI